MAPAGRLDEIAETLSKRQPRHQRILEHADPLVERHLQRVEGADVLDDAVTRPVLIQLLDESAEHTVPDDQRAGKIGVEIARIGSVVDAVVRWRVEDEFEPAPHLADGLGVDPRTATQD